MINVYIREAHPDDGWKLSENSDGNVMELAVGKKSAISYMQTHTLAERLAVGNDFQASMGEMVARIPLLIDDPATNAVDIAYEAPPERLVVVDPQGKVAFCSGQGPFQYSIKKLAGFLETACA